MKIQCWCQQQWLKWPWRKCWIRPLSICHICWHWGKLLDLFTRSVFSEIFVKDRDFPLHENLLHSYNISHTPEPPTNLENINTWRNLSKKYLKVSLEHYKLKKKIKIKIIYHSAYDFVDPYQRAFKKYRYQTPTCSQIKKFVHRTSYPAGLNS